MRINLLDLFDETVAKNAQKIAIIDRTDTITFGALQENAKKLATMLLQELRGVKNRPIAVFMPKCMGAVVSDIGITYSGNIFMNMDVKTPLNRLEGIINTVDPVAVITTSTECKRLVDLPVGVRVFVFEEIDFDSLLVNDQILVTRRKELIDTDPWCIINTSGSTGTPKGVVLNHRSFFDFIDWSLEVFGFTGEEVIGSLSPIIFDIYNYELCLLMSEGATIVLLDATLAIFPVKLLQTMREMHVNFIFWVPTIMVNIANMDLLTKINLPDLNTVWFAGEVFPTKQFNYWRKQLPNTLFANLYGPIEITLDCTYYIVERSFDDDEPLPIGYACKNTDILLLTDEDKLAGPGEEGEICVRGTSLAMGYYNNPEKTASAFTQNPLNTAYPELIYRTGDVASVNDRGEILFKGRKDSLIKHMGYRIELGEIEHVITNKLKLVENCCVVYNMQAKEITLFYESKEEMTPAGLRKAISAEFPKYMIPVAYHRVDLMPRNANGKIDRLLLSKQVNKE